jgi:hypothetical protein
MANALGPYLEVPRAANVWLRTLGIRRSSGLRDVNALGSYLEVPHSANVWPLTLGVRRSSVSAPMIKVS